jgi:hypothetical protein
VDQEKKIVDVVDGQLLKVKEDGQLLKNEQLKKDGQLIRPSYILFNLSKYNILYCL